jgi:predicted metalloendopeptidase
VVERFADTLHTSPIVVNARYNLQFNGIDITAANSQLPYYKPGADLAVNYCTMGAVIGHQFTHDCDSNSRQYDAAGNVRGLRTPQATADFGGITLALAALQRAQYGNAQPKMDGLSTDQRCCNALVAAEMVVGAHLDTTEIDPALRIPHLDVDLGQLVQRGPNGSARRARGWRAGTARTLP